VYAPVIRDARRVREHLFGDLHSAVLLTDIEQGDWNDVEYAHLLVLFERHRWDPIAFISSEVNKTGIEPSAGSHFLCAFLPTGRRNFGENNDWADLEKFDGAALELMKRLLLLA